MSNTWLGNKQHCGEMHAVLAARLDPIDESKMIMKLSQKNSARLIHMALMYRAVAALLWLEEGRGNLFFLLAVVVLSA